MRFDRLNKNAQILRIAAKRYGRNDKWGHGYRQAVFTHNCGTPACAFGHYAAAHPRRFAFSKADGWPIAKATLKSGIDAAKKEFCLCEEQALELFGSIGCGHARTALEAAKYIEGFIRRHGGKVTKPKEKPSVKPARAERRTRR